MKAAAEDIGDWLKIAFWGLAFLTAGYVAYLIVSKLTGPIGSIIGTAGGVAEGAVDVAAQAAGFSFSSQDATAYPGYKPGNWNKMLAMGAKNPLSLSYQANSFSNANPGPTQVHTWAEKLDDELNPGILGILPGVGGNINTVFSIFQQIPDQDNVNLVYHDLKTNHKFDLATDVNNMEVSLTDTAKDVIASIIMIKPITAINNQ